VRDESEPLLLPSFDGGPSVAAKAPVDVVDMKELQSRSVAVDQWFAVLLLNTVALYVLHCIALYSFCTLSPVLHIRINPCASSVVGRRLYHTALVDIVGPHIVCVALYWSAHASHRHPYSRCV
jgi:hypothetical protein